jgi:hypothetical protein
MINRHYSYLVQTLINGEWVNTTLPVSLNMAKKIASVRTFKDIDGNSWRYVRDMHISEEDYKAYMTRIDELMSVEGELSEDGGELLECMAELCEHYESCTS